MNCIFTLSFNIKQLSNNKELHIIFNNSISNSMRSFKQYLHHNLMTESQQNKQTSAQTHDLKQYIFNDINFLSQQSNTQFNSQPKKFIRLSLTKNININKKQIPSVQINTHALLPVRQFQQQKQFYRQHVRESSYTLKQYEMFHHDCLMGGDVQKIRVFSKSKLTKSSNRLTNFNSVHLNSVYSPSKHEDIKLSDSRNMSNHKLKLMKQQRIRHDSNLSSIKNVQKIKLYETVDRCYKQKISTSIKRQNEQCLKITIGHKTKAAALLKQRRPQSNFNNKNNSQYLYLNCPVNPQLTLQK